MRDSAGIVIVENSQPAPDSRLPWEIGAQPSLSIGSVESGGADELFRVTDAIRLGDGRIVVANMGTNELKVFGPDGSHSGTWGRRGEGPGEFTAHGPTAVAHWPGDSVAAADAPYSPRLPIFDMNGNHGRIVAFEATRGGMGRRHAAPLPAQHRWSRVGGPRRGRSTGQLRDQGLCR